MSETPDSTLADSEQLIADLQRQLADCRAERDEGLQRETATAEVLQVINSSPGDLTPVFDAMLEKATRLCEAAFGMLSTYNGERFDALALHGVPESFADFLRAPVQPVPGSALYRLAQGISPMLRRRTPMGQAILRGKPWWSSVVPVACSACRYARTPLCSVPLSPTAERCAHSLTSRSRYCRISPRRRSSQWRMRG